MKQRFVVLMLVFMVVGLYLPPAFAQATGSVKGICKDLEGKPIVGAIVEYYSQETGRKLDLKTNNKGEYFSLGVTPGKYRVTLSKDGKELDKVNNFPVNLDENTLDFDLKKSQSQAAQQKGISPEQLKQMQEQQEKAAKETNTVKALNEKLQAANQSMQAGDFDSAVNTLTEATQMDATRDLLWARLGDAYAGSAPKQTDPAEKTRRFTEAAGDYQKAVDIKQKAVDAQPEKKPDDLRTLASYYNNLGQAESKLGKTDDAVKAYDQAAKLYPAGAPQFYFNLGAVLTNANTTNDAKMRKAAIDAFDKAIAADPNKPDAYYWKGVNLMGDATLKGDKMVAPDGTAEAFNKYLELQPTGPHAEEAKAMLASIGATIQTQFGKKKAPPKK
jgi:tetratricopeptide (TPR) repeat protein